MLSLQEKLGLEKLVQEHGLLNVVELLANIATNNADIFADMQLKEEAIQSAAISDKLDGIVFLMKQAKK
jgi:hypothetical protein